MVLEKVVFERQRVRFKMQKLKNEYKLETLTIIIPVFNEYKSLPTFSSKLDKDLKLMVEKIKINIVFVNNGSTDGSLAFIRDFKFSNIESGVISLTRNFGYEVALLAGLESLNSDIYCLLDADGEDPSDLLIDFFDAIQSRDFEIAIGIRGKRHESLITRMFRKISYFLLSKISDEPFWRDAGNFSMFTKSVRNAIVLEKSTFPFLRSRLAASGYSAKFIKYDRMPRIEGKSNFRRFSLLKFAVAGFLTTTTWPLRAIFYSLGLSFVLLGFYLYFPESDISRLSTVFLSAVILCDIAFISLYIARIYKDTRIKKLYQIDWNRSFGTSGITEILETD
jgi:glycosyltransferase involved in cell wall biosynthesis